MLIILKDLCAGCGFCRDNCPQGAISIIDRKVFIDSGKCNDCGICVDICPRGAITLENVKMKTENELDLTFMSVSLRQKAEDISEKLEKIIQSRNTMR